MTEILSRSIHRIMLEAAELAVMPHYQSLTADQIVSKAANDAVTVADHEAEAILSDRLSKLLPEAAIVGEEAAHADPSVLDRLSDDLCWIIDPIDGTNNFAAGKPPFGILIALAERGHTIGGWIYDPLRKRFCHSQIGKGAYINGERIFARSSGSEPPIAAISLIFADQAKREALKTHIAPHYTLVDIPRCAAEQYPRIVLGENDITIFYLSLAWDHAAGVLFLNEAGGKCCRADGSPYLVHRHLETGMLGASTPALWDALAERMSGI